MDKLQPPQGLRRNILIGIANEELRRAKIYFAITASVFPMSLFGAFWSGGYLMRSFYESGFYNYLLLLFSGDSTVLMYWKELVYSFAETIPIMSMILFLTALGFLVWSGASAITNVRRFGLVSN